jgi:hypothetical protein
MPGYPAAARLLQSIRTTLETQAALPRNVQYQSLKQPVSTTPYSY